MTLTLKIISLENRAYPESDNVVINEGAGTIGRSETCTLVLPDENKMISRRHATITFDKGDYRLTDNSLAGTFIDNADIPINNDSVELVDGMLIGIGDYIIQCQVTEESSVADEPKAGPFADDLVVNTQKNVQTESVAEDNLADQLTGNSLLGKVGINRDNPFQVDKSLDNDEDLLSTLHENIDEELLAIPENNDLLETDSSANQSPADDPENDLLDSFSESIKQSVKHSVLDENISSLNDSFTPASPLETTPSSEQEVIPEDFNFEELFNQDQDDGKQPEAVDSSSSSIDSSITPQISLLAEPPHTTSNLEQVNEIHNAAHQTIGNDQLFKAFLDGAKIDIKNLDIDDPEDRMTLIGAMFRQFVESTVAVLRNRAEFKSLFRVTVTTIKKADNNPLKFSITTEEAVKHLINDGQGGGFKKSVDSIDEGFNDLLNHQLAMQAGIQASLNEILRQFDPMLIEQPFEQGIVLQKKSKCWDKYRIIYNRLSETAVEDFFGDTFAEAYEQQMKQLKK